MVTEQILVPLKRHDRVEEFLPYVEDIARPGMRVVFLVYLGRSGFKELTDQLLAIHTGIQPELLPATISEGDVLENRRQSAEARLTAACVVLRKRGVKIEVNVYAGRLQRIIDEYLQKQDVQFIMMRPGGSRMMRFLRHCVSMPRFAKLSPVPPVLLVHPSNTAQR
jgi:hypothetical protein